MLSLSQFKTNTLTSHFPSWNPNPEPVEPVELAVSSSRSFSGHSSFPFPPCCSFPPIPIRAPFLPAAGSAMSANKRPAIRCLLLAVLECCLALAAAQLTPPGGIESAVDPFNADTGFSDLLYRDLLDVSVGAAPEPGSESKVTQSLPLHAACPAAAFACARFGVVFFEFSFRP